MPRCARWRDGESRAEPPLKVIGPQFLLQLLVVALDPQAHLGGANHRPRWSSSAGSTPVLARLLLPFRPLDQQPFLSVRLGTPVVAVRRPHPHAAKRPSSAPLLPSRQLPSARRSRQGQAEILGSDRLVLGIPAPQCLGGTGRARGLDAEAGIHPQHVDQGQLAKGGAEVGVVT